MKITGCMLCYNEKHLIRISVLNMLQHVDNLVICDGQSTDGTLDILSSVAKEYKKIRIVTKRQDVFRNRNASNREHYGGTGFNEIERRNFALSQCDGDYILLKDVDELYHENTNFHKIIETKHLSYNELLYEVANENEYFSDVRIRAHHDVPKLIRNEPAIKYGPFDGSVRAKKGIDCILFKDGRKISQIDDIEGAYDRWHYKMLVCRGFFNRRKKKGELKKLPAPPKEHKLMIQTALTSRQEG